MSTTSTGQTAPADYCTMAPDAPFGFDFSGICAIHDDNYGPSSTVSRSEADRIFYESLQNACDTQYGGSWLCHMSADIYYIGVRLFGGLFYEGPDGG